MDNTSENQNIPEVGHTPLFISKSVFSNDEPIEQLISDFNPDEIANINSRNDNLHFSAKMEPECISDEVALKEAQLLSKTTVICNSIICSLIAKEDNTSLQTIEDEIEEMKIAIFANIEGALIDDGEDEDWATDAARDEIEGMTVNQIINTYERDFKD